MAHVLFRQMKYFIAVVNCNSFTEAAEACFISQSAMSQQINALEKELGVKLLHRKNRTFTLTPAGDYFYRHAQTLLADVDLIVKETKRIGIDEEEHLNVGYLKWYGNAELQHTLADFSTLYPEVTLNLINGDHEQLYHLLVSGDLDLVLSAQRRVFSEDYNNHHLLYADCYIEVSKRHPLSSKKLMTIEVLGNTPCIILSSKEQQDNEKDFYQNILGFKGNFLFSETLEEARLMVINNRGFLPIESVGTLQQPNPTINRIPLYKNDKQLKRNYCAFWPIDVENYYIEEFIGILEKYLH